MYARGLYPSSGLPLLPRGLYQEKPVSDPLYYFGFFAAELIVSTHRSNIKGLIGKTNEVHDIRMY